MLRMWALLARSCASSPPDEPGARAVLSSRHAPTAYFLPPDVGVLRWESHLPPPRRPTWGEAGEPRRLRRWLHAPGRLVSSEEYYPQADEDPGRCVRT